MADIDGDGDLDIITGNDGQNRWYPNDGDSNPFDSVGAGTPIGTDTDETCSICVVDIDGDGDLDVIAGNDGQNKWYPNDGDSNPFNTVGAGIAIGSDTNNTLGICAADIDGDGDIDVIAGNSGQTNKWYPNDGDSTPFNTVGAGTAIGTETDSTLAVLTTDLDRDGDLDIITANYSQTNKWYPNDGDSSPFDSISTGADISTVTDSTISITVADINRNGNPDVLVGNSLVTAYSCNILAPSKGTVVSKEVDDTAVNIHSAVLSAVTTAPAHTSIEWYLSNNGGAQWQQVTPDEAYMFPASGNDLRWKAEMRSLSPVLSPEISEVNIVLAKIVEFSAASYAVDEDGTSVSITVNRLGASADAISIDYDTSDGTATEGDDYTAASGTLNWVASDMTSKTFTVNISDDTDVEGDETIILTLSNPGGGATIPGINPVTLTINEDDSHGTVEFSSTFYVVAENGVSKDVYVYRTGGSSGAISVDYTTSSGTATEGDDYTAASGTLNWTAGNTAFKIFTVNITDDTDVEGDETFNLTLSNPGGGAVISGTNPVAMTIIDSISHGNLEFSAASYAVDEDGTSVSITVNRTDGNAGAVSIDYATSDNTATQGVDYEAASGTLYWLNGEAAAKTFTVNITDDTDMEGDETIALTLSNPSGGAAISGTNPVDLTITEDDSNGTLEFSETSYTVNEDGTSILITVNRVNGSIGAVSVDYDTSDGTATESDDYTAASGTLSWADGNTDAKTFTVNITDDSDVEGGETVTLTLSNAVGGASISGTNPVDLTINDDDSYGTLEFSATSYTVNEGDGSVLITVNRIDGSMGAVSVDYDTSDGTATEGDDYTAASSTLSWADGNTDAKTFTVNITDDLDTEGDETVTLTLSNAVGGAVISGTNPVTLTITNNIHIGSLEFSETSYTVNENGTSILITVNRIGGSNGAVSIDYDTSDGTATAGVDYDTASGTLDWADGNSDAKTFTVNITDDTDAESDETITLTLSNAVGGAAISGTNPVTLTISENGTTGGGSSSSSSGCNHNTESSAMPLLIMVIASSLAWIRIRRE